MKSFLPLALLLALLSTLPALADVSIGAPGNGADVSSPFNLSAWASNCSGQNVSAMGYSIDSSSQTTIIRGSSINTSVSSPTGTHTLHVKAWGTRGGACVADLVLHISDQASSGLIPWGALKVSSLQVMGNWKLQHDPAVGNGWSSGNMSLVGWPSRSGTARKFVTSFSNNSGELYHISFGDDTQSTNFFYDAWVYLDGSSSHIQNLEMDMNQTMANGQTVIYGIQCDGWTSTWDYTKNAGSPSHPSDVWVHSHQYCNPRSWGTNSWHHVQLSYSRNDSGVVTYHSVWLDGRELPLNATVPSAFALGWGPTLLSNFQVDGLGTGGTATVYLDDLTISRW